MNQDEWLFCLAATLTLTLTRKGVGKKLIGELIRRGVQRHETSRKSTLGLFEACNGSRGRVLGAQSYYYPPQLKLQPPLQRCCCNSFELRRSAIVHRVILRRCILELK